MRRRNSNEGNNMLLKHWRVSVSSSSHSLLVGLRFQRLYYVQQFWRAWQRSHLEGLELSGVWIWKSEPHRGQCLGLGGAAVERLVVIHALFVLVEHLALDLTLIVPAITFCSRADVFSLAYRKTIIFFPPDHQKHVHTFFLFALSGQHWDKFLHPRMPSCEPR